MLFIFSIYFYHMHILNSLKYETYNDAYTSFNYLYITRGVIQE